jgi:nitrogen fixation NifU-like protein
MKDEFRELYQEIILDHNRSPRNYRKMVDCTHVLEGSNPLCGDHYIIYLKIKNGIIEDVSFEGSGCAISKASASVMSTTIKGKTIAEANEYFDIFRKLVTGEADAEKYFDRAGKIAAFSGVSEFPVRVKCASLAWHTMHNALKNKIDTVSTE